MSDIRAQLADVDFSQDAETREARHELLASFLGAYADGELPAETQSQIDAHLTGCARCRRELDVHRAVRDRLGMEPVPAASAALRQRIALGMKAAAPPVLAPAPVVETPTRFPRISRKQFLIGAAILVPAIVVGAYLSSDFLPDQSAQSIVAVPPSRGTQLMNNVMADYRTVMAGELPGRELDLVAVRAAVSFTFTPLTNPSLRLLRAWRTSISGEPAAVLAYRWNERVVLQYFVSDALLFQSPDIRASLARQRAVFLSEGGQSMLLWAEPEYGTMLVGDLRPDEFAALRAPARDR